MSSQLPVRYKVTLRTQGQGPRARVGTREQKEQITTRWVPEE